MRTVFSTIFRRLSTMRKAVLFSVTAAAFLSLAAAPAFSQETADGTVEAVQLFNQAQDFHEKGDIKTAVELYREALTVFPDFPEAEYQLGSALRSLGDTAAAEAAFRRAVKLRGDWTLALAALGSTLVARSQLAEAEPILLRAIKLDDQNFPAYAALADLKVKTMAASEELEPLLAALVNLTGKANPPASAWIARGLLERQLKMYAAADISLTKALQTDPANIRALYEKAEVALALKDPSRANKFADEIAAVEPAAAELNILRANILIAEGNSRGAIAILKGIKEPPPEAAELLENVMLASSDNTAELEAKLTDNEKDTAILGRLCTLFRTKDAAKALEYCRRASELEPDDIGHAIGFGAALVQAKRYPEAAFILRKLLEHSPDNFTARANLATALFMQNDFAAAKIEYRRLIDDQPNAAIAYYFLAICHDRLREYPDAMANYQAFLRHADPVKSELEIDKTKLRMPALQEQIKKNGGKRK